MAQQGDQATHIAAGAMLGASTGAAAGAAAGTGTGTGTGIGGAHAHADGSAHDVPERPSKGPGPAAVGRGHRPALNDWKFPSTPRVATPAPYEPQVIQSDARPSSPSVGTSHQQQAMDYFTHPVSSYALTAQQQQQQQLQHHHHQQQQQQQATHSHGSSSGPYRDGSQTPKSPYSFSESLDGIPAEDAPVSHQAQGIPRNTHSQNHSQSQSQSHNQSQGQGQGQSQNQSQSHSQTHSQSHSQSHSHSHSQSQDSVGISVEHPGMLHNLSAYQHQILHDAAQPGHIAAPNSTHPLQQQLQPGMSLMPHQLQTPSEFALKMLFTQFVKMAEAKLNAMVHLPLQDTEPDILSPLKHGVDPKFDKLLASLGSVARHRPQPVIECVLLWRKGKIESADDPSFKSTSSEWSNFKYRDPKTVIKERKSMVSLFIMSRSLIEILSQVQRDTLPEDLGQRLEEEVFSQLENADPYYTEILESLFASEFIRRSSNRTANMNILVELMGSLSNVRFATVSDRFIAELEKYKTGVPVKDKERELRMEMLIRGMRFLNLKLYPMDCLEETADFLQSCAGFFKAARGIKIKQAYAELFVQLMTPVAKVALAEVNHPNWSKTVELIYPKARKMTNKPRHVQVALPLVTMLLCVSKKDFFLKQWIAIFELCRERFRDKLLRQTALNCASQLIWVFLNRCSDGTSSTFRSLDNIVKSLFPLNRKSTALLEGSLGHFIRIVHFIGARHPDYATRSIIFLLLNLESLSTVVFTNLTMDMISPERMTIAVRSFMLILADLDKGTSNRPPFPTAGDAVVVISDSSTASDYLEPSVINRANMRDTYEQMAVVLGRIAFVCDRNYGHTLILDEKYTTARSMFSAAAIMATATGDSGASIVHQYSTFAVSYSREKQVYFDLMTAWVTCLPRCMPSGIPLLKLVEMLSRYTAHVDPELRKASAAALVRIANQCNSQVAVAGYSAFVCTVEDRLSELLAGLTVPGSGIPAEIGLLGIYIQILEAWIRDTTSKNAQDRDSNNEALGQNSSEVLASPAASAEGSRSFSSSYVPEVDLVTQLQTTEENGLLFLCNPSPVIRRYAISILKLAASFDQPEPQSSSAGGDMREGVMPASISLRPHMEATRVYHLLQNAVQELLLVDEYGNAQKDCPLALPELIRLQIHHHNGSLLAGSENSLDVGIWRLCFPLLITKIFECFPGLCEPCLDTVSRRLMLLYPAMVATTDLTMHSTLVSKFSIKTTHVATEEMIEQWRAYLMFVCSTMVRHEHQSPAAPGHGRKKSAPTEKITCARDLFRLILPLLSSDRSSIRESVVTSLGRINHHLYKPLLEDLQPTLFQVHDDFRSKSSTIKASYQSKRNRKMDRLRAEIAHIFDLTAPLLKHPALAHDEHITSSLKHYVRETLYFLVDTDVQQEWEYVKLRTHFCGFVSHLYNGISQIGSTESIIPFDHRLALFKLFQGWCGHGSTGHSRDVEHRSIWYWLDQTNEIQMAEKFELELAALRAMASLCKEAIHNPARLDRPKAYFNIDEVFGWIESVFSSPDERLHSIAQDALEALLIHNQDRGELLEDAIHQCYAGDMSQKFIQGHFRALVDIILRIESYPCQVHQMLSLALFKCGDSNIQIRTLAIKLLKVIELRHFPEPCAGEYEIGIVNKLPTIYRQAQYVLSARLAQDRPEQTYSLLSEAMMRLDLVGSVWRGEMLFYIAPWLGNVELLMDEKDELSMTSFVVLTNLFYLTVKYGDDHVKEVEHLWVQLVAGDNFANIRPILVFLLDLSLEKRNPEFVHPAKKVIVFLGRTSACSTMVDILTSDISPKAMVPKLKQERNHVRPPFLPDFYLADLDSLITGTEKGPAFSRGQLATVLLVDLAVEAGAELRRHLPLLLQALFVQLDHYTALIRDQTRSLLVHLIHSIIIRESRSLDVIEQSTDLVDFLNTKEGKPLWAHEDISQNMRDSPELESLVYRSIQVFQASEAGIRQQWGETALQWATTCPVRHIACRSFQIFRALAPSFNHRMLVDMLARLSNTIADKSQEIQAFAMEILISLQSIIAVFDSARMMQFPLIFWGAITCLYTGHDQEYMEGLKLLEIVTNRLDVMDQPTLEFLLSYFPEQWDGAFMGIQPLLLKGLRSTVTEQISLRLLRRFLFVSENALIDPSPHRAVFLFLGVLPLLAEGLETKDINDNCMQWAQDVGAVAERDGHFNISHLLTAYAKQRFRSKEDFWRQIAVLLRDLFIPELQAEMILFFMRLLYNSHGLYKHKALKCLKLLLPLVDTGRVEFLEIGPELVLPLLRLLLDAEYATEALEVLDAAMNLSEQSAEIFRIRVPLDAQSPGLNFEDMTKGILGGGTGLERRAMTDNWVEPRREHFWQMTRANVNAVVMKILATTFWDTDVEEHEMGLGYPMILHDNSTGIMDFVDHDGMHIGVDSSSIYGNGYSVDREDGDVNGNQDQYGHLVSALDDLTEHFAESALYGEARKRESAFLGYGESSQNHWNYRQSLLMSDPNILAPGGVGGNQASAYGMGSYAGDGLGLNTGLGTGSGFSRGHRHSRRGSKGSRDEFGSFYAPNHERIVEDDEDESTLMAAEILNKSLSVNRSYSSIRSSFLMEPSSFVNMQEESAADSQGNAGSGSKLSSSLSSTSATTKGSGSRVRLYAPGHGHHTHRSSSGGSGSGGASGMSSSSGTTGTTTYSSTNIARNRSGQSHRAGSSNAGSNSSSIIATAGMSGATASSSNSISSMNISGHRARASCDDLSLSSSDDDDEDDDDDSTDSDDDDYDGHRYHERSGERHTRERSFEITTGGAMAGTHLHSGPASGHGVGSSGGEVQAESPRRFVEGHTPTQSQPSSRAGSHAGSRTGSRPGSMPGSPSTLTSTSRRSMDRITARLTPVPSDFVPNVYLSQK